MNRSERLEAWLHMLGWNRKSKEIYFNSNFALRSFLQQGFCTRDTPNLPDLHSLGNRAEELRSYTQYSMLLLQPPPPQKTKPALPNFSDTLPCVYVNQHQKYRFASHLLRSFTSRTVVAGLEHDNKAGGNKQCCGLCGHPIRDWSECTFTPSL